jgi:DNA-binding NtrC family response regulator
MRRRRTWKSVLQRPALSGRIVKERRLSSKPLNRLRVLFVDDEAPIRQVMLKELPRMGHDVTICEDGQVALKFLEEQAFDAAIVDLRMPGLSGWDVIDHLQKVAPETEIIISTGHGSLDDAIQALRRGAYDFLTKPTKLVEIANVLQRIAEKKALTNKAIALEHQLRTVRGTSELIGDTPSMGRVKKLVEKIAPTDSSVLILGETGTGKELVARSLHGRSARRDGPFVALNCAALPSTLLESELFGFEKGSFTGAHAAHAGHIERAHHGTLFLDEIAEMQLAAQAKLLRVLQERRVQRLGSQRERTVDVRFLAATHQDLVGLVEAGAFRRDLYPRLDEVQIRLPPLRERQADVEVIAQAVAAQLGRERGGNLVLSPCALEALRQYTWPGNVRELENTLRRAATLTRDTTLTAATLDAAGVGPRPGGAGRTLAEVVSAAEENAVRASLRRHRGDVAAAASELGVSPARLREIMQARGIGMD